MHDIITSSNIMELHPHDMWVTAVDLPVSITHQDLQRLLELPYGHVAFGT
jgi:hypothetical protein